jgi:hypothetical protein
MTAMLGPLVVDAADPTTALKNRVRPDVYVRDVESMLNLGAWVLAHYQRG